MAIRFDSVLVRGLARELDEALAGARLRAIRFDGEARDVALLFRDRTLLWRLRPDRGHLRLSGPVSPESTDLRARARMRSVSAPPDERVLRFELRPERAGQRSIEIVVELLGTRRNAIVIEGPDAVIRHVLVRREGSRTLVVGRPYERPRPTNREGAGEPTTLERWREALGQARPAERASLMTRRFAWTSPLNAATILGASASTADGSALAAAYERWRRFALGPDDEPVVVEAADGPQPYPVPLIGAGWRPAASLLAAFEACADAAEAGGEAPVGLALGPALRRRLDEELESHERRLARLRDELGTLEDPVELRAVGDLILARFGQIPAGASEVDLADFTGAPRTIELAPELRPHENADRYYARAGRAERARARLPELIARAERARDRIATLREGALEGAVDPDTVRAALPARIREGRRGARVEGLPYRVFRSSGGLEIRVGRGARFNDELTFRHSSPEDVWLHARHAAGAHVVLRWTEEGAPPGRDLAEAATLAALHSKARTSGSVPVDWTRRKHVRKPRGAGPGTVVPDRVRTVFVRPDPSVAEALAVPG